MKGQDLTRRESELGSGNASQIVLASTAGTDGNVFASLHPGSPVQSSGLGVGKWSATEMASRETAVNSLACGTVFTGLPYMRLSGGRGASNLLDLLRWEDEGPLSPRCSLRARSII